MKYFGTNSASWLATSENLETPGSGIQRNKVMLRKAVLGAQPFERWSSGGIYLGQGYAMPVAREAHDRACTYRAGVYRQEETNLAGGFIGVRRFTAPTRFGG
jgi:hypothetical protein